MKLHHFRALLFTAASLAAMAGTSLAQELIPHAQDAPPGPALSPAEAIAKMQVPPGFVVESVVAEPMIVNPVAMTFDDAGRIWITESLEYPRLSAGKGRDRSKFLRIRITMGKPTKSPCLPKV